MICQVSRSTVYQLDLSRRPDPDAEDERLLIDVKDGAGNNRTVDVQT
jgi:hypothetical protein